MKKLFLLPILALSVLSFVAVEIKPIDLGASVPNADSKLLNVADNSRISLNDSKKLNGLLVIFSCNTCPYVITQEDRIREIQANAVRMQIGVVIINSNEDKRAGEDSPSEMKKYAENQKYTAPYVIDSMSVMADAFGATRTPETFLFDKDGKLVYRGSIDDSPKDVKAVKTHYLLDAMTAVSKGKPVPVGTSVSSGCSIKRVKVAVTAPTK
jgi:thioredoxin-related protein